MRLSDQLRRAATAPPHVTVRRVVGRARRAWRDRALRRRDRVRSTYAAPGAAPPGPLATVLAPLGAPPSSWCADTQLACATHFLAHRFDLLGSGWVVVRHGMSCAGLGGHREPPAPRADADRDGRWLATRINRPNVAEARRVWRLIEPPYEPIDWPLDFKSGYRWSEQCWHEDVPFAHRDGVDIKVPWELARLQHLPQLAATAGCLAAAGRGAALPVASAAGAFRNQVLDFIATNPPRYGVNWRCTMDVAIRIANVLVARDLLVAHGAVFDGDFERVLRRSVYEHGRFIVEHLEWGPALRSNHYLSNVVGLLFVAAYLSRSRETDAWLAFAVQELVAEVDGQFHPDGSNFEGSTSYHRLSTEMVAFGTALVLGLPPERRSTLLEYDHTALDPPTPLAPAPMTLPTITTDGTPTPFPASYLDRLERAAGFTRCLAAPHGARTQIGDNDSGRFVKLAPRYARLTCDEAVRRYENLNGYAPEGQGLSGEAAYWREDGGDHGHLVEAVDALFGRIEPGSGIDAAVIAGLAGGRTLAAHHPDERPSAFPDFGVYVYRAESLTAILRCGSVGQRDNGGHAHNDQLSVEMLVGGAPLVVDPGTYLYTPQPATRNEFRSTAMHNTVAVEGREQNPWTPGAAGLFSLRHCSFGRVLVAEPDVWRAEHVGYGEVHERTVRRRRSGFEFEDQCAASGARRVMLHLHPEVEVLDEAPATAVRLRAGGHVVRVRATDAAEEPPRWRIIASRYSDAYGWCRPSTALALPYSTSRVTWLVEHEVG